MNYKCAPIFKYITLLVIIYMFMKHQNILTSKQALVNSCIMTLFVIALDFIIIEDHPTPFEAQKQNNSDFSDDDIEKIIDSYDKESEEDEQRDNDFY